MTTSRRRRSARTWAALLRVHAALVPELDARMQAESGLPLAWYDVLLELVGEPSGRLRMSDLAARVTLSRSRVSRVVDELAAAGLATKSTNADDRRSTFAAVTPAGRETQRAAAPGYLAAIERGLAGLSVAELDAVATALETVLDGME